MVRALDHQGLLKLHQDKMETFILERQMHLPWGFLGERSSGSVIPSPICGSRSSLWAPACNSSAVLPAG